MFHGSKKTDVEETFSHDSRGIHGSGSVFRYAQSRSRSTDFGYSSFDRAG
jgi:hypothetical protein